MSSTKWLVPLMACAFLAGSSAKAQVCAGPPQNLTSDQVRANNRSQISLDGKHITYTYPRKVGVTQNEVWVMNADGSGKAKIPFADAATKAYEWSALSADGSKIAFHAWDGFATGQTDLFVMDLATGETTQLTTDPAMDAYPALSPDGSKILFLSKRFTGAYNIFMMNTAPEEGENIAVQLTNFTNTKYQRFTPDGKIIFGAVTSETGGAWEVFRMDAKDADFDGIGDNLVRLTNSGGVSASEPSQITAGGRIFYVGKFSQDGKSHVFSMKADGTDIKQVTGGDYDETYAYAAGNLLIVTVLDPANGVGNADIVGYPLTDATDNGTISGTVTGGGGAPVSGATVKIYTKKNLVTTVTTDSQGQYTATVAPGGYSIEIVPPASPAYPSAMRGATVWPGGDAVKNIALTPSAAPKPTSLMATYTMDMTTMAPSAEPVTYALGGVSLTWAGGAPGAGYSVSGYNVYAANSEVGPWTKVNTDLVSATAPLIFMAPVPADPAKAFYAVTAVVTNCSTTLESALSDAAQAANNMLWNGSFDNGDSIPVGYDREPAWWNATDWVSGVDADNKVGEGKSVYHQAGSSQTTVAFYSDYTHTTPVTPLEDYVTSMYAKFTDNPGTGNVISGMQYAKTTTTSMWWGENNYPAEYMLPTLKGGGTASPNVNWTYLPNTNVLRTWEDVDRARFAISWDSTGATVGTSRVYYDDARMQVRRVGATGTIYGRIQQSQAKSTAGILVSAAGKSVRTDSVRGQFVLRDVPTGMVELTFTFPDYDPDVTPTHQFKVTVPNYGGFAFGRVSGTALQDTTIWETLPRTLMAIVKDENGNPIENANVRFVNWKGENEIVALTDAKGEYSEVQPDTYKYAAWWEDNSKAIAMANAPGRVGKASEPFWSMTADSFAGWDVAEFTLPRSTVVEALRTFTPPTIDGNVTTAEWNDTQKINLPFSLETGGAPVTRTTAYAKWDNDNLYLAFASEEPNPAGMVALSAGHSGSPAVWAGDDLFGAWMDPTNFGRVALGHEYWQLLTNSNTTDPGYADVLWRQDWANGQCPFLWSIAENIFNLEWKSRVDASGKMYYTEMKIPFGGLGATMVTDSAGNPAGLLAPMVAQDTEWAVNLQRFRSQSLTAGENAETGIVILRFVNALTPSTKGDLNGDHAVTAVDAAIALRIAAGMESAGDRAENGDVFGSDGKITPADALRILRKVNGLETNL